MTAKALSPLALELIAARHSLAFFKGQVQFLAAKVKEEKLDAKLAKSAARHEREASAAAKREAAIAKAQARLEKLLAKQVGAVGTKAIKANRKPSKVVVTEGAEANAIAAAIMAKKAKA
jgi:hypothetical protein